MGPGIHLSMTLIGTYPPKYYCRPSTPLMERVLRQEEEKKQKLPEEHDKETESSSTEHLQEELEQTRIYGDPTAQPTGPRGSAANLSDTTGKAHVHVPMVQSRFSGTKQPQTIGSFNVVADWYIT